MVADDPESFADLDGHYLVNGVEGASVGSGLQGCTADKPQSSDLQTYSLEQQQELNQAAQNQTPSVETATRQILFPVDFDPTSGTVAMQSVQIQGRVDYHGHQVSDPAIRAELMEISFATGQTVNVTSGDRNFVPTGGAKNSEHLKGHASPLLM